MTTTVAIIGRVKDEAGLADASAAFTHVLRTEGVRVLSASLRGRKTLYDVSAADPTPTEHVPGLEGGTHHYPGRFVLSIVGDGGKHADIVAATRAFLDGLAGDDVKIDSAQVEGHGLSTHVVGEPATA